ncbi:Flp family type IVb pilin [Phenylobacterium sp. LH3H17]|uniref:Flp family type IVb pilin n=1 Tax=Phenylobacterium sp. LH3H17 TaxID=2903901 RepID=UPI0020C9B733|nr:Flp family type IVb pilin [Phenylobacterium sp. LH3H17]UTP39233.1 Flp family type IVb pilin [Phenylobacterium sp. LH3H17]
MAFLHRFIKDQSGSNAVEYGIIAALITVTLIGGMMAISASLTDVFGQVIGAMPQD